MPKCSVLIIEDEKNIQTFMGKVLKRHDYRVLYADTGTLGLEVIRSQCPDIILLDLGLPDMSGDDLIREVRTWSSIPIIVISARTAEREKVIALDLGADDYITKPLAPLNCLPAFALPCGTATVFGPTAFCISVPINTAP